MAGASRALLRSAPVAAIVAVATCFAVASASAAPLIVTGNFDGKSASVINTQTDAVVGKPIELGSKASAVAIVPGGAAYVAESENNSVTAIDPRTGTILKTIPVGGSPEYVAVSPDGKTLYVTDVEGEEVSVVETVTDTVQESIPVGGKPYTVAFAPSGQFAYVSVGNTLVTINSAVGEVVGKPIPIGEGPHVIAFSPDGTTVYVSEEESQAVGIVSTALREEVGSIPLPPGAQPWGVAVSPDGRWLYVSNQIDAGTVTVFSTATHKQIGEPIEVGERPFELAFTPNGKTLYVADYKSNDVTPIDTETLQALTPIPMPGLGPWQLAITPDQSPTAAFSVTGITAPSSATFDGGASTDPDGRVSHWAWEFGDGNFASEVSSNLGTTALGPNAVHSYPGPGTYPATLTVLDNEGCGVEEVFTGRTAYCSGNPLARVTHPVTVKGPPAPAVCSAKFAIAGMSHNRRNGTVRLRLRFKSTGSFLLFGKKVHAVTRKVRKPGTTLMTLHARVELAKRLKKTLHASVRYRVTFTPSAGCGSKTMHRSVALLRAPRRKHHA